MFTKTVQQKITFFLVNVTTLTSDNSLCLRKNLLERI